MENTKPNTNNRYGDKLVPQDSIDLVLRFHLYCAKINRPIGRSYKRLLTSLGGGCANANANASQSGGNRHWEWRGLPAKLPGSTALIIVSTSWMGYAMIRVLLFDKLSSLLETFSRPYLNKPGSCLLLGRLVAHPQMETAAVLVFSGFHWIWRSLQYFADHNFKLSVLQFLLHSEHDLEQFYTLMDDQDLVEHSLPEAICVGSSPQLASPWSFTEPMQYAAINSNNLENRPALRPPLRLVSDVNELLLRHSMCYLVYHRGKPQVRLRPNRSREAKRKLADRVMQSFIMASMVMLICAIPIGTYCVLVVFSDWRYAVAYPGCSRHLDELNAHKELPTYGLSSLPKGHRLLALIADAIENMIIWTDCGLAITFVPTLGYVLNYDILLYWSSLHSRVELILQRARKRHQMRHNARPSWRASATRTATSIQQKQRRQDESRLESSRGDLDGGRRSSQSQIMQLDRELGLEIHELQFEIFDFFNEVKRVDLFVSDLLTLSIIIWLVSWLMVGHNFINGSVSSFPLIMILIELVGWCVIVTASYVLLELRRSCLRSYCSLCSLMALDDSNGKRQFIRVMEFYTQLNRTTYSIAHSYPYEPTTFISIMGYSASCFILTLTLFNPHGSLSRVAPKGINSTLDN